MASGVRCTKAVASGVRCTKAVGDSITWRNAIGEKSGTVKRVIVERAEYVVSHSDGRGIAVVRVEEVVA